MPIVDPSRLLRACLVLAAGLLKPTAQVLAADDYYNLSLAELAQVEISIATGNSTPLDRAPATASVVSAAEIEAMGARTLNDVLETLPGVHVSLSTLSRLDSVYSIRGIHTGFNPQVLLLVNGIPVQYSVQGGRPTLFRMPAGAIDRVEVIRGPGSAIYGADAYAGVINVITKDVSAIKSGELGVRAGSFESYDAWFQGATDWRGIGISLNLNYQTSQGDSSRKVDADLQTLLDSYFGTQASLAPGALATRYELLDTHLSLSGEPWQLNLWNWTSKDGGVGAGGAQALDPKGGDEGDLWMVDYSRRFDLGSNWDSSLRLSYLHYVQDVTFYLFPAGTVLPIGPDGNINLAAVDHLVSFPEGVIGSPGGTAEESQAEWVSIYSGWDAHRVRVAVGGKQQSVAVRERKNFGPGVLMGDETLVGGTLTSVTGTEYVFLPDSSRNIRYISLQDEWQLSPTLGLTSGVRYDDYSDFGGTTNPRIALVWSGSEQFTTKLLYGSAFRAPSFSEQRFQNNPVSLGNQALKPEQIDTLELSFKYSFPSAAQTTLTLFQYKARDMIDFIPDAQATTKTAQNARNQNGQGFEWEFTWEPVQSLRLSGSYSYQDARDDRTDTAIPDAPGQQLKLNVNWELAPQWFLNGQAYWIADRARAEGDPRAAVPDYTLLNMTLRRQNLVPNLDLTLAARNLGNTDAREPSTGEIPDDYPLEGRSVWLELSYRFK